MTTASRLRCPSDREHAVDALKVLGFTHVCAKTSDGRFFLKRITISKRKRAKLKKVKDQLKRRRHAPLPVQGAWLASVVRGHAAYYLTFITAVDPLAAQAIDLHVHARSRPILRTSASARCTPRCLESARYTHPMTDAQASSVRAGIEISWRAMYSNT